MLRINGQQLVTTSAEAGVKVWTLANGTYVWGYYNHTLAVKSVTVLPNDLLATGGCHGTIKVWNTPNSANPLMLSIAAHAGCVNELKYHPTIGTSGALVSVGQDRVAKVWNLAGNTFALLQTLGPFNQPINCFVITPSRHIIFGSNRIDMWTSSYTNAISTPGFVYPMGPYSTTAVLSMALCDDGVTVACGMADGAIRMFSSSSKTLFGSLSGHTLAVNAIELIQLPPTNVPYLMSGSDDAHVYIWNQVTFELVKQINIGVMVKSLAYLYNETSLSIK